MSWLASSGVDMAETAGKAALMYGTALFALRLGERRTLAQWGAVDFAAAVAIGAIVGRTAVARTQSYAVGAIALVTLLVVHRLVSWARFAPFVRTLADHRVRVLVADGRLQRDQLRRTGVTEEDLDAQLRQRGFTSLNGLRYVIFEAKGGLTVVPDGARGEDELVRSAVDASVSGEPRAGSRRPAAR